MSKKKPFKKEAKPKRRFHVEYRIVGRAWANIEAESFEEARRVARSFEVDVPDGQVEWEFDELKTVAEVDS